MVVRGGTPHFEYVCDAVTAGLTRVALDEGCPSATGCSPATPTSRPWTARAARVSAEDKGAEACVAALDRTALVLRDPPPASADRG